MTSGERCDEIIRLLDEALKPETFTAAEVIHPTPQPAPREPRCDALRSSCRRTAPH